MRKTDNMSIDRLCLVKDSARSTQVFIRRFDQSGRHNRQHRSRAAKTDHASSSQEGGDTDGSRVA